MCYAFGILRRAEYGYSVVGCPESFDTFIGLLAIVQAWCHSMDTKEGVFHEFRRSPFPSLDAVMRFDVPVDWFSVSNIPTASQCRA